MQYIKNKIGFCIIIFLTLGIIFGLVIGFYFWRNKVNSVSTLVTVTSPDTVNNARFLNPAVISNSNKYFIINFQPLREKFIEIQKKYPQKTYIYFNYLNNSSWVGLNEKDMFSAASTVKVPLAMSIYKLIEDKKLKESDSYALNEEDLDNGFGDLYKVGAGKSFTIEGLLKIMLEKSDNTAELSLYRILRLNGISDPFSTVYNYMGWEGYTDMGTAPSYIDINLKTLSNMFISLYNADYVNPDNSAKILEYLDNSPFDDKIVAGLPTNIPVAHKIGIMATGRVYSDCGIVYVPNRNYLLCLGSSDADEATANEFMKEISAVTYEFVSSN